MSSSEDSETAEWEREQMLRGTQSRGRHQSSGHQQFPQQQQHGQQQPLTTQPGDGRSNRVNASLAKSSVNQEISKVEAEIESIKRNIGATRVEMIKSAKRINGIRSQIDTLESAKPFLKALENLRDSSEVLQYIEKSRQTIMRLPPDQRETIGELEQRLKEASTVESMKTDDQ